MAQYLDLDGTKILANKIKENKNNKLDKTGGTVTGKTIFNQGTTVKNINGGGGTSGYMHIAQIKINGTHLNQPITFNIRQRERYGTIIVKFNNHGTNDPGLHYINKIGNIMAYIHKVTTSTWNLYIQKSESWDSIDIVEFSKGEYMQNLTVAWQNATVTALPSGFVTASNASIDMNTSTASKLQTTRNIGLSDNIIGNANFDGSGNITINARLTRQNLTDKTIDLNTLNHSDGTYSRRYIETTTGGCANISNAPVKEPFILDVELIRYASSTDYISKQTFTSATTKRVYERYCTNGTWSGWNQVYTTTNKPSKVDIGLGNVDNTSDINKPISTATQNALNGKANTNHTHNYAGSSSAGGAANSANKLTTTRNIALAGSVSGNANFDGSGDIKINTTPVNKALNDTFVTNFRQQVKGDTNPGSFLSPIRQESANVSYSPQYGSGIGFGVHDTHGYLYTSYSNAAAYIGAGNAGKLNWTKQLAFTDSNVASANKLQTPRGITVGNTRKTFDGTTDVTWNLSEIGAYTKSEIDSKLNGKANSSHTHTKAQITDMPTSMKNPTALTVQFNGVNNKTYDGSTAQTVNITPSAIGAASSNHNHDSRYYTVNETNRLLEKKATIDSDSYRPDILNYDGDRFSIQGRSIFGFYNTVDSICYLTIQINGSYDRNTDMGSGTYITLPFVAKQSCIMPLFILSPELRTPAIGYIAENSKKMLVMDSVTGLPLRIDRMSFGGNNLDINATGFYFI